MIFDSCGFLAEVPFTCSQAKRGRDMALDWFNPNVLYILGRDLQTVCLQAPRDPRMSLIQPLARASVFLDAIFSKDKQSNRPLLPLKTAEYSASRVKNKIEELYETIIPEKAAEPFDPYDIGELTTLIQEFQTILAAELGKGATYVVHQLGLLAVDTLIKSARVVFEGYEDRVPEPAKWDTDQAGRCLAFDLPTAAGFHIARATEAVLLEYLRAFGKTVEKQSQRNWGQYTTLLRETDATEKVITTIDQIRTLHRNPLLHPEQTLEMPEAMSLWAICCSAIQAMVADIERKRPIPDEKIVAMLPPSDDEQKT
jgi:hypothetical protein